MRAHVHLPRASSGTLLLAAAAAVAGGRAAPACAQETIKLGLVAAMSGQSAKSGEAIVRGLSHRHRRDQRQGRPARQEGRADRARRREQSRQGRDRGARAGAAREGRRAVRRPRHAGVAGDRAVRQPERRCRSWACGRRARRSRATARPRTTCSASPRSTSWSTRRWSTTRSQEIQRQEARHDPDQQSLGRIEREGPQGRARRQEHAAMPASRSSRPTTSTWCRS